MMMLADWLQTLGTASLGSFWLPVLAWTTVAFAAMTLLRLWRSAHTLVHYTTRTALLMALPLGLLLAAATDLSILALFPSPAAEAPIEPLFVVPFMEFAPASSAPAAPAWTLYHLLGAATVLAALLAAGRLYYLARHTLALTRFRKRLPRHTDAPVQHAVDRQAAALGIQRRVRAVVTTQDIVPMTLGWLRPLIVVPETLIGDEEHLHMTLLHELIHIRRQDVLLQGVEYVIGALFLINPAVWLLRRSIGQYREMSCDADVVTQPRVSSKRYAALLYRFASPPSFRRRLALSMSASDKELKKRILAMKLHNRPAHRWLSPKWMGLVLAALLLTSATAFVACSDLAGTNITVDEATENAASKTNALTVVDEMPELIGGLKALQEQLRYPAVAREAGIEGRVIISFVVDKEGRVTEAEIVKGLGSGLDEEAVRVITEAQFKPGRHDGEIVPVKLSIPFTFKLNTSDTTSDTFRMLNETFTLKHPEMSKEDMYAFTLSVYAGLSDYRSQIQTLEERLQNNPAPSEKATIEAELKTLQQQVKQHIEARFSEIQVQDATRTPEGNVELPMKMAPAERAQADEVDHMPKLIGGPEAIQADLKYPTIAKRAGIEGRVILRFVVDEQGRAVDPEVVQGLGGGCDEEALRVLQQTRFEPALKDGQPVPVEIALPITFKLGDDDRSSREKVLPEQDLSEVVVEGTRPRLNVVNARRTASGIAGRVIQEENGQAAPGAEIRVKGGAVGTAADLEGNFLLKVSPDVTDFVVKFVGFEPVALRLSSEKKRPDQDDAGAGLAKADPLYVVDGLVTPGDKIPDIDRQDIESVTVLKGEAAQTRYGARGAHGVVEITTVQGK